MAQLGMGPLWLTRDFHLSKLGNSSWFEQTPPLDILSHDRSLLISEKLSTKALFCNYQLIHSMLHDDI